MSQFPKARPSKGAPRKRGPKPVRTHVPMLSGTKDWDSVGICDSCGFRQDHRIHDLNTSMEIAAAEIDARRLGESGG